MAKNLKTAITHMRRTPYQALSAIGLAAITFFVITIFTLLGLGTGQTLKYLESRPQVTAFFQDETTNPQIDTLRSQIENANIAQQITYISKDEALEIYRNQNQDNPLLLEMVTADILPASLEVSAHNVEDLEQIARIMQEDDNVEEVVYQKDIIDTLKVWTQGIRITGIALSAIFLLASIMTITVVIGLRTAARKEEINTLSLLGATQWYIKGPFVVEGVLYGVSGAFFGWALTYIILLYLTPNLAAFFQNIPLVPVPVAVMFALLAILILLGGVVGTVASLIATRRYGK